MNHDLDALRGCLNGCLIALVMWAIIIWAAVHLWRVL
jgi:hypothetical protein